MNRDQMIESLIKNALAEDLQSAGDVTSKSIFNDSDSTEAVIRVKESGVLSGVSLIVPVFTSIDSRVTVDLKRADGDHLVAGEEICRVKGPIIAVLSGERLALNLLQHLSGIATATSKLVNLIRIAKGASKLLDTRKTTPGLRMLEKEAVVHGGGTNHRIGLFDMILAKDTHVKAAGGPDHAVERARKWCHENSMDLKIEVEVESLAHFERALAVRPDRIMLDNMSCEDMSRAVELRNREAPLVELEASGNVSEATIVNIAKTGVDFISVGAITHSVKALDIHLSLI